MDLGMNDTLNWGYMHCMIAASREMSDEPLMLNSAIVKLSFRELIRLFIIPIYREMFILVFLERLLYSQHPV